MSLREDILTTLRKLQTHADALGAGDAIEHIYQACHTGSDAGVLRQAFEDRGSVEGMVDCALQMFRQDETGHSQGEE